MLTSIVSRPRSPRQRQFSPSLRSNIQGLPTGPARTGHTRSGGYERARAGCGPMTVLIEIAPVGSRGDWVGSFDPVIVPKPERRPGWAAFCSSRPAGDRAQAGAAARGVTGSCSHVSVSSGPRGGSSCTPGRSTASRCLAGMRSAELAQEGWLAGRLPWESMPPDALNPLHPAVLLDALVLKGLSRAGAPRPVACVSTRS